MTEPEPTGRSTRLTVGGLGLAARIGTQVFTRVRVEGDIDAIPAEGPVILAANHVSNLDGVLLGGWVIARVPRRIHWLGKREIFELPIVRGVLLPSVMKLLGERNWYLPRWLEWIPRFGGHTEGDHRDPGSVPEGARA